MARAFLRKPKRVFIAETDHEVLEKNLTLWDLICIGVGSTVGSGVFVLTGVIAHSYSGPAVVISWIVAGVCSLFSAVSYAELSSRIPSTGSSYAYVYNALGELPAVISAWCLTLEYGISGAAVARSWGEKFGAWLADVNIPMPGFMNPKCGINVWAGVVQAVCTILMMAGVELSKLTINFFSTLKVVLVLFMIGMGFAYFRSENVADVAPYGYYGIMRGATSAFFGYIGYDEVCCMAAEAHNPKRALPIAVFSTIAIVTILYVFSSLALVGMIPYSDNETESGFSAAFGRCNNIWAQQIVAVGEILVLPVVVLVSFLAQPRLQYAMARDGLLAHMFGEVDEKGNLANSIIYSGIACTIIAMFVPFKNLNDMISAGVLISFNLTNSALIIIRYDKGLRSLVSSGGGNFELREESNRDDVISGEQKLSNGLNTLLSISIYVYDSMTEQSIELLLVSYHILSLLFSFSVTYCDLSSTQIAAPIFLLILILLNTAVIYSAGKDRVVLRSYIGVTSDHYMVPYVPFTPLFGILVNYYLFAQLSPLGLFLICSYMTAAIAFYFYYGYKHSVGNNSRWSYLFQSHNAYVVESPEPVRALAVDGEAEEKDLYQSQSSTRNDGLDGDKVSTALKKRVSFNQMTTTFANVTMTERSSVYSPIPHESHESI